MKTIISLQIPKNANVQFGETDDAYIIAVVTVPGVDIDVDDNDDIVHCLMNQAGILKRIMVCEDEGVVEL